MSNPLGKIGEKKAAEFLENLGFMVIARNFRGPIGEIDIVALNYDSLVFVEVKTWNFYSFENLSYGINAKKQHKIIETAKYFLSGNRQYNNKVIRFDVIFLAREKITHIASAFTDNIYGD